MHILLTGTNGDVGREQLVYLVERGHTVIATDIIDLLPEIRARAHSIKDGKWSFEILDCRDMVALEALLQRVQPPIEGVIHYGAISHPLDDNFRLVHNNNVVGSYNILEACASRGINRVVQASSVNAPGLGFAPDGHITHDHLPIDETCAMRPEDPYSLSKQICEVQAAALCRYYPGFRVASLRFHAVKRSRADMRSFRLGKGFDGSRGFWAWSSHLSCCRAGEQALLSEGWGGAEAFYIIADEILTATDDDATPSLELLVKTCDPLRYGVVDRSWWKDDPRRGFWNCDKAKRLLGWKHEE